MEKLLGPAFSPLEQQMHFRVARQGVLAANLANADTPGYRRAELKFDERLAAAEVAMSRNHAGHVPLAGPPAGYRVEIGPKGDRPDGNGVQLDRELVEANRNAGAFMDFAGIMSRIVSMRRLVIAGR